MKVYCLFSLESPNRGDSNEYTQHNFIINMKRKSPFNILNIIMSAAMGIFLGTQERVRNSRGKRAISVWATEVQNCKKIRRFYGKIPGIWLPVLLQLFLRAFTCRTFLELKIW